MFLIDRYIYIYIYSGRVPDCHFASRVVTSCDDVSGNDVTDITRCETCPGLFSMVSKKCANVHDDLMHHVTYPLVLIGPTLNIFIDFLQTMRKNDRVQTCFCIACLKCASLLYVIMHHMICSPLLIGPRRMIHSEQALYNTRI